MSLTQRLKTTFAAVFVAASFLAPPALGAGTTPLSLVQQFDSSGQPLAGCLLNFFVAGTVASPQNAYADFGLTAPLSNPVQCDQSGRVPQHWLADGLIHIRLTDSQGTPIIDTTMQVLGPSSGGGGGGGTVDPTAIMSTGDLKFKYATGPLSGFVRLNALTIGNVGSGASERANADTQALFVYLYGVDPNLVVSGGRTGNALNDFNAGKQLTLPDWRGRAVAALDDMGNSAAGNLTATYFGVVTGCNGTVLGCAGGKESQTLTLGQLPTGITSQNSGIISATTAGSTAVPQNPTITAAYGTGGIPGYVPGALSALVSTMAPGVVLVTSNNTSGGAHPNVQPTMLATFYIKL